MFLILEFDYQTYSDSCQSFQVEKYLFCLGS